MSIQLICAILWAVAILCTLAVNELQYPVHTESILEEFSSE